MKKTIYRKWQEDDDTTHYLKIYPNGLMTEIKMENNLTGFKTTVYHSKHFSQINIKLFKQYKDVCFKKDFDNLIKDIVKRLK